MEKSLARFAVRHPRGINFVYAARDQWLQNLPIICVSLARFAFRHQWLQNLPITKLCFVILLQLPRHRQCGRIRPLSPGRRASVLL